MTRTRRWRGADKTDREYGARGRRAVVLGALLTLGAVHLAGAAHASSLLPPPPAPVEHVNLPDYLGTWYQLAAVPQPFNLVCARDTQARYALDDAGNVGPIGGIQQKLAGARDGGAAWFLAPTDNCSEVLGAIPDGLTVVKVSTFDDARKAVEEIAAGTTSGLPHC